MHSVAYQEVITRIPQLTEDEQLSVIELIRRRQSIEAKPVNGNHSTVRRVPIRSFEAELSWLKTNRQQYRGQWVALKDGQLILSDSDGKSFSERLKTSRVECPFIDYIETEAEENYIGGLQ